jgi:hypothetical protein
MSTWLSSRCARSVLLAVDGEGDALARQRDLLQPLASSDLVERERLQRRHQLAVVGPGAGGLLEGLVVGSRLGDPLHGDPE